MNLFYLQRFYNLILQKISGLKISKIKNTSMSFNITILIALIGILTATSHVKANSFGDYLNSRYAQSLNNFPLTADLLNKVLLARPDDAKIAQDALLAFIYAGRYQQMKDIVKKTLANNEKPLPLLYYISGLNHIIDKNYDAALNIFDEMQQTRLEQFTLPLSMAWAEVGRNNFDTAIEIINGFDNSNSFHDIKSFHLGSILALAGKYKAAESTFLNGSNNLIPISLDNFRALIRLKLKMGNRTEARNILTEYMALYPDQPLLEDDMINLMQNSNLSPLIASPEEAIGKAILNIAIIIYKQSKEIGFLYARLANWIAPKMPAAIIFLATIMEDNSRFKHANQIYKTLPQNSSLMWDIRLKITDNLFKLNEEQKAINLLKLMVKEKPGRFDALISLANIYRRQEEFKLAATTFDQAISRLNPIRDEHFYIYYYAGMMHERAKQWSLGEPMLLKALELRPNDANILNYLGYSWIDMGINIEKAQIMIRKAVDKQRHNGYIVDSLGWAYYRVGKFNEAITELERAVLLLPQDATVNDHLGDAYWQNNRQREARYQWLRAVKMKPTDDMIKTIENKLANGLSYK